MTRPRRPSAAAALLIGLLVALTAVRTSAAPQPAFRSSPTPPAATPSRSGAVESQSGDYSYQYPIVVPPGRNGVQPSLAFAYSSADPPYGSSIGQGWSLAGAPAIQLDTRDGLIGTQQTYRAGGARLVRVSDGLLRAPDVEGTYRAEFDASFAKYELLSDTAPYAWRVRNTDGSIVYFGKRTADGHSLSPAVDIVAPIARREDAFGNVVDYEYRWGNLPTFTWESPADVTPQPEAVFYELTAIRYGKNEAAGLEHHALVELRYGGSLPKHCDHHAVTIGSAISYRSGRLFASGVTTLQSVTTYVRDEGSARPSGPDGLRKVREYALTHDATKASCTAYHAPRRVLAAITETGWAPDGTSVALPPTRFYYGEIDPAQAPASERVVSDTPLESHYGPTVAKLGFGEFSIRPTVLQDSMLVDMNGDGLPDRLELDPQPAGGPCSATWYENTGTGFGAGTSFWLPSLPWRRSARDATAEFCSLDGQATHYQPIVDAGARDECDDTTDLHPSHLSYGWEDADGDGDTDLVMAYYRNPAKIGSGPPAFSTFSRPPSSEWLQTSSTDTAWFSLIEGAFTEEGECGLHAESWDTGYLWYVFDNDGSGTISSEPEVRVQPLPYGVPPFSEKPDSEGSDGGDRNRLRQIGLLDYNGDGYRDAAFHYGWTPDAGVHQLLLLLGDENGFFHANPATDYPYVIEDYAAEDSTPLYYWCSFCPDAEPPVNHCDLEGCLPCTTDGGLASCTGHVVPVPRPPGIMGASSGFPEFFTQNWLHYGGITYPDFDEVPWSFGFDGARIDLNGDGLLDWVDHSGAMLMHTGTGVEAPASGDWTDPLVEARDILPYALPSPWDRLLGTRTNVVQSFDSDGYVQHLVYGRSYEKMGWVDFDEDGLLDKVYVDYGDTAIWNAPAAKPISASVALNFGGVGFLEPKPIDNPRAAFAIAEFASHSGTNFAGFLHRTEQEGMVLDLDGDGLHEYIYRGGDGQYRARSRNYGTAPPGLLTRIVSSSDGETRIEYAPSSDLTVVSRSTDSGRAMKQPKFVVKRVTSDPIDGPELVTSYRYVSPVWNRDHRGHYGFRGFEKVWTTSPSGSLASTSYDYDLDYRGLQVEAAMYASAADVFSKTPVAIESTEWEELYIIEMGHRTFHPVRHTEWVCGSDAGSARRYDACKAAGPSRTTSTKWKAIFPFEGGDPDEAFVPTFTWLMWAPESQTTFVGPTVDEIRKSETSYLLYTKDFAYRLRPYRTVQTVQRIGEGSLSWDEVGRIVTEYDAEYKVPSALSATVDDEGSIATTRTTYDPATGNVVSRSKPQQVADCAASSSCSSPLATTMGYDTVSRVFVTSTTNELGHVVITLTDPGTGAVLESRGPNSRQITQTVVDGFGRPIQRLIGFEDELGFRIEPAERITYDDDPAERPGTSVVTETYVEAGGDVASVERRFDGLGRPVETITATETPLEHVETYEYDSAGRVVAVTVPDPSSSGTDTVRYESTYDSLGRLESSRDPNGNGVDFRYPDALVSVREETAASPAPGEALAETTTRRDAWGRLVEVTERVSDGAPAVTSYAYDSLHHLSKIVDADGIIVDFAHDRVGNRTLIVRGGRQWSYTYDLNGNQRTAVTPRPAGAAASLYTVSTAYDALDRPTSRMTGTRSLSSAEIPILQADVLMRLSYDASVNGVGQPARVEWGKYVPRLMKIGSFYVRTFVWEAVRRADYAYEPRGMVSAETRWFDLSSAGFDLSDERTVSYAYNLMGLPSETVHADGPTPAASTRTEVSYGRRGLPASLWWQPPGRSPIELVSIERNVAGHVTRHNAGVFVRGWGYDRLGRVATDWGIASGFTHVENPTYHAHDDVATVTSVRPGLSTRTFAFDYDAQHQIVGASDDRGYEALFTYSPGGRLDTAFTAAPASAPLAFPRDVTYDYTSSPDPEAVDRLIDEVGDTYVDYAYDEAGGITRRSTARGTWSFAYDGHDRQRRVVGPDGSSELYYYGLGGARWLSLERDTAGRPTALRFVFGDSEIWYDAKNTVTKTWAHVSAGTPVARIEDFDRLEYTFHNGLGHLMAAIDASGAVTAAFVYGPFGEVLAQTGDVDNHLDRFNGKRFDIKSGLSYYGYRYYDPQALVWTRSDPLFRFTPERAGAQPRMMNLYTFSLNNPLRYVDPDGLCVSERACYEMAKAYGIYPTETPLSFAVGQYAFQIAEGFAMGAEDMLGGLYQIARHPVQTVEGLLDAAAHPIQTAESIMDRLYDYFERVASGDPHAIGKGLFDAATIALPAAKGAGLADDVGRYADDVARLGDEAVDLARTADVATTGAAKLLADVTGAADDLIVLGRQADTAVAAEWAGHKVLNIDNWSLGLNDNFIRTAIRRQQNAYLASPRVGNMIQKSGRYAGEPTIFARELKMLENAGYKEFGDYLLHPANVSP